MTSSIIPSYNKNIFASIQEEALSSRKILLTNKVKRSFVTELPDRLIKSEDINDNISGLKYSKSLYSEQVNSLFNKAQVGLTMKIKKNDYEKLLLVVLERPELSGDKITLLLKVKDYRNANREQRYEILAELTKKPEILMALVKRPRLSLIDTEHNNCMTVLIACALYNKDDPLLEALIEHPCLHTNTEEHNKRKSQLNQVMNGERVTL